MRLIYSMKFWKKLRNIDSPSRSLSNQWKHIIYGKDVIDGKNHSQPIVALESTIITHGMPFPENFQTALKVEDAVKKQGAIPATIGIIDGIIHVGLDHEQLKILSKSNPENTVKCSARDLSSVVLQKLNGGTTVSATMLIANLAGIPIMATGGIGGVHREAETTFDISTDLIELGRTPIAVVCSGVKSILDIGKTLEYLETQGVPVVNIGNNYNFPAFYCAETYDQLKAPFKVKDSKDAADLIRIQRELNLSTGILLTVSVPNEHALNPNEVEIEISKALEKAKRMHIKGKYVTPLLLKELNEMTSGKFLKTNIALIENNAKVAAEIAKYLCEEIQQASTLSQHSKHLPAFKKSPVVVGAAIVDTILQVEDSEIKFDGRMHAGQGRKSCGGVGRNLADALIKLGAYNTRFISVVGNDEPGTAIFHSLKGGGGTLEHSSNISTANCTAIIDAKGECCFYVGEMDAFAAIDTDLIKKYQKQLEEASIIVIDANLPTETMALILDIATHAKIPVWYEPTDIRVATKIFEIGSQWENALHFISPNKYELLVISKYLGLPVPDNKSITLDDINEIANHLAKHIPVIISTLGSEGVLITREAERTDPFYDENGILIKNGAINSRLYRPLSQISKSSNETFSTSGCGDCFAAGIIYGIHKNLNEENCINLALKAADLSLKSYQPVPSTLSNLDEA
ncbi:PREDICTED: pseudouridine-metabolizing bifunctional protein C1861.05 [Polistes dominula]|uniref:Pseudouridine-metabolizing bifunctional protein C1861.05 n=1 Tax=Polistes dominula TaxID=743375 RepID=A0ABM1IT76_POLDO|nr:PREDICTED: pseudouridine-metabolizing bifunctional protein C1861.05 [Polistes dominula]XP_015183414.1 PREDICTED: pseudouridine-metabolizing bifunctional protein C1861.05 [Polistes dominula]